MATIEITPTVISVGVAIFVLIVGSIIWFVRLQWKINAVEEKADDHEKRLKDVESKINAYSLAKSIDDYIELKLNAYSLAKSKLDNTGDKK